MTRPDRRAYHRALALYCLHHASSPSTAGDLTEVMGTLAQSEGHPRDCWLDIHASSVSGILRSLENDGVAKRHGSQKSMRKGRDEPTWVLVGDRDPQYPMPDPAAHESEPVTLASAPAVDQEDDDPSNPYAKFTRPQLYALLAVQDDMSALLVRFLRDFQDVRLKAHKILERHGLEVTP